MPVGNPKPQTVATRKYEQKTGWVSKSYKLKKDVVEEYSAACKKAGVSAAGQIRTCFYNYNNRYILSFVSKQATKISG